MTSPMTRLAGPGTGAHMRLGAAAPGPRLEEMR
jgi:hypothetical protein